jgi:hypothetical protein
MEHPQTHHHRSKSRTKKQTKFEQFLSSPLFIILGILSILAGVYSMRGSGDGHNGLYEIIMAFFAPQGEVRVVEVMAISLPTLFIYFLPPFIALSVGWLY